MASLTHPHSEKRGLIAYAQLVRLPNAFTAMADICMAAFVVGALPGRWFEFSMVLLASTCLYCSGMVWNDVFDIEQDQRERPHRPLASGRISVAMAGLLGITLMAGGVALAGLASWTPDGIRALPIVFAGCLVLAIFAYNGWLKHTPLGPGAMGTCRLLNVLLGLSVIPYGVQLWGGILAFVVGLYIFGVTWFARTEATTSNRQTLIIAAALMLAALLLSLLLPTVHPDANTSLFFPYLLAVFGFVVGLRIYRAIDNPIPRRVQPAVKTAVLGLIALDAILATAIGGIAGLGIVLLLVPAIALGRWLYST